MLKKFSIIFIAFCFIFSLGYFYLNPVHWDDYHFAQDSIQGIYSFKHALTPGRHVSESINIISERIFGTMLGSLLNSPLLGMKIVHSIVGSIILLMIWLISAFYIAENKKQFYILLFILPPLLSLLHIAYIEYSFVIQIWGGFVFALIAMCPFIYYYKNKSLNWFDNSFYGIWIALLYLGTQITEGGSLPWVIFSILTIIYIYMNGVCANGKKLLPFLGLYIGMFLFSIFRTALFGSQTTRAFNFNFDLYNLYHRVFHLSRFHDITIMIGSFIALYYVYYIIKYKQLSKINALIAFLIFSSLSSTVLLTFQRAGYFDQSLWILWMAEIMLIIQLVNKFPKLLLIIPTIVLGLYFYSAKYFVEIDRYRPGRTSLFLIQSKKDWFYINKFVAANKNNEQFISFTDEEIKKYDLGLSFNQEGFLSYPPISEWMLKYGYTDKIIPIKKKNKQDYFLGENK